MTDRTTPKLPKWPFFLGDVLLLALAGGIVALRSQPFGWWEIVVCLAAVGGGAALAVWPFVLDHRALVKASETGQLTTAVAQIRNLEAVSAQLTGATARWQTVQDSADKTAAHARQIVDLISHEAKSFQEFLKKSNDTERAHLRLEIEKANRSQQEWIQLTVHLLDHIHALHQAGVRSGQATVINQLTQFQNACRDMVRRVGLVAVEPELGEPFNEQAHQLLDPKSTPLNGSRVANVVATGFNFQGQPLRKALVVVEDEASAPAKSAPAADSKQPALF